jgi:quercetin dioxygenase-like cupin family protein
MTNLLHIPSAAQDLAPGDLLGTDPARDQLVHVTDGILYVRRDEDDAVLIAGDSIALRAGEPRRAWNAGDETARVVVSEAEGRLARAA